MEMADTPMVDKGAYAMLGSDDFFLRMLSSKKDQAAISDYVGWTINASKAMGIKVVNPGGISSNLTSVNWTWTRTTSTTESVRARYCYHWHVP